MGLCCPKCAIAAMQTYVNNVTSHCLQQQNKKCGGTMWCYMLMNYAMCVLYKHYVCAI